MSVAIMPYLVCKWEFSKLNRQYRRSKLHPIFNLFKKVQCPLMYISEHYCDKLDELNSLVADNDQNYTYPECILADQVLKQSILKSVTNTEHDYVNGYIFELLCNHLGQLLPNDSWTPSRYSRTFSSIPFTDYNLPYDFQLDSDYPVIVHIDHLKIKQNSYELEDANEEQYQQLESWFNLAQSERKDLYLFCY